MNIYIALLRGINVSGQNIIKMKELAVLFETMGFKNVSTYIQSGNIVFQSEQKSAKELENDIHRKIKSTFGFDVPVFVLEAARLQNIIEGNPFAKDSSNDISFLHVTLTSAPPAKDATEIISEKKAANEAFLVTPEAVYLFCPNGYGKTKLNNTFLEKALGVKATTRNWKTIIKLQSMVEAEAV